MREGGISRNDCEKFIQRQDIGKGMGGKSDYEKMVMAAVVHDARVRYACGRISEVIYENNNL